jgi:hypothetical protein
LKICSNEDIETEAEGILAKYIDQDFSYADAVSFCDHEEATDQKRHFALINIFVTAGFINVP